MIERKMGIQEASAYSGMSTHQISYAAKCDPPRLRGYKVSEFGPWFFTASDLDAWLDSLRNAPAPAKSTRKKRRTPATR